MHVNAIENLTRGTEMRKRALELACAKMHDDEIAAMLTSEGHRSPSHLNKVLPTTIQRIRQDAGIKIATQRTRWHHPSTLLSATELAAKLNIPVNWISMSRFGMGVC